MNPEDAEQHDIEYYIHLSVAERQAIAGMLKKRAYGDEVPDIREYHKRLRQKERKKRGF